jgi:hypothetical protein
VCHTDDLLRWQVGSFKRLYERLCVPDQTLVRPVHTQGGGENVMTTAFEFVRQKLPASGALAAAMNEEV